MRNQLGQVENVVPSITSGKADTVGNLSYLLND